MRLHETFWWLLVISLLYVYIVYLSSSKLERIQNDNESGNSTQESDLSSVKLLFGKVLEPPGVILKRVGGIGNQASRFSCSYALAKRLNWPLYILVSSDFFADRKFMSYERKFVLDQFNINPLLLIDKTTLLDGEILVVKESALLDHKKLEFQETPSGRVNRTDIFIEIGGYCHSEKYWEDYKQDIKSMLYPRPESLVGSRMSKHMKSVLNQIRTKESVAVHIRLGDFATGHKYYVPTSFHRCAMYKMSILLKNISSFNDPSNNRTVIRVNYRPTFFVFSDDIKTAKQELFNVTTKFNIVFVSALKTNSLQDFYLMSQCKHFIIPISTFSWWTAYLSRSAHKIVISASHFEWKQESKVHSRTDLVTATPAQIPLDWIVMPVIKGKNNQCRL